MLTVESKFGWYEGCGKRKTRHWNCVCECGKTTVVVEDKLKTGATKSCGCLLIKTISTHDMYSSNIYRLYYGILQRCYNPKSTKYAIYGGAGVTVCDRWLESFENFYEDMGERPEGLSLNRVNGAKIYSKETCEWATYSIQSYDSIRSHNKAVGVIETKCGTYQARIGYNCKILHLGTFSTLEEAVAARQVAELKYYGFVKPRKERLDKLLGEVK